MDTYLRSGLLPALLPALCLFFTPLQAASLSGAWERTATVDGERVTQVLLFADDYFSWTAYRSDDGDFLFTRGGHWQAAGKELVLTYEFDTADPQRVGQRGSLPFKLNRNGLRLDLPGEGKTDWTAIDAGRSTPLTGAWLFAGRKRDGELERRSTDGPRKTMKLLTGNRFQWIAYNTESKEFFGTGGGTYTAEDGKYVEKIGFFSRDKGRVGAELSFDFDVQNGEWHHSGLSSRGDPMYEIWAPRE